MPGAFTGNGIVVGKNKDSVLVLSNNHMADRGYVYWFAFDGAWRPGHVINRMLGWQQSRMNNSASVQLDLAVWRVPYTGDNIEVAEIGEPIGEGSVQITLKSFLGGEVKRWGDQSGIIFRKIGPSNDYKYIEGSYYINIYKQIELGQSGGGVFTKDGKLVGVLSQMVPYNRAAHSGNVVSAEVIKSYLSTVIEREPVSKKKLKVWEENDKWTRPVTKTKKKEKTKIEDDPYKNEVDKLKDIIEKGKKAKAGIEEIKDTAIKSLSFATKVGSLFGYGELVGVSVLSGGTIPLGIGAFKVGQYLYRRRKKKKKKKETQSNSSSSTPTGPDDLQGSQTGGQVVSDSVGADVYRDVSREENDQLRSQILELENNASKVRKYIQVPIDRDVELYRRAFDIVVKQYQAHPSAVRFYKLVEEHFILLKSGRGV